MNTANAASKQDLLPDFCDNRVILVVILIAQLLATVLTLANFGGFTYFAYTSFFIQSVALLDAALLCYGKRWLNQLSLGKSTLLIYILLQLVTLLMTIMIYTFIEQHLSPLNSQHGLLPSILRNVCISAIITAVALRYFHIRHQNHLRLQAENLARIQALEARIRPHFLFNSLNTIANLVHIEPDRAEDAVLDLAELFRSTLAKNEQITLAEELEISQRYLRMEQLRLGDRLTIEWQIPEALHSLTLPALVLQPLIENAIYHGIEPLPKGGTIKVRAEPDKPNVQISVSNPIIPKDSTMAHSQRQHVRGNRVAMDNIRQRLALAYGNLAALNVEQSAEHYTVILVIPEKALL